MGRWLACLLLLALVLGAPAEARADKVDDLIALTSSQTVRDRAKAAFRLGRTKDPRAMAPLAKLAMHDGDAMVRKVSLHALRRLAVSTKSTSDRAHARGVLLQIAQNDPDRDVRKGAAAALKQLGVSVRIVAPGPRP